MPLPPPQATAATQCGAEEESATETPLPPPQVTVTTPCGAEEECAMETPLPPPSPTATVPRGPDVSSSEAVVEEAPLTP
jgi:hypothetical protein